VLDGAFLTTVSRWRYTLKKYRVGEFVLDGAFLTTVPRWGEPQKSIELESLCWMVLS